MQATGADRTPEDLGNDILQGMVLVGETTPLDGSIAAMDGMTVGTSNGFFLDNKEWP